jgi:hypothetical protein
VHDNSASTTNSGNGGGIASWGGSLELLDCDFYDNSAVYGGNISIRSGICAISNDTTIIEGNATWGGGIFIWNCTSFSMMGGTLAHNAAVKTGGGLHVENGTNITLTNVTINENNAYGATGKGGGFYIEGGIPAFHNCTLSGNTAFLLGPGGSWKAPGNYTRSGPAWADAVVQDM